MLIQEKINTFFSRIVFSIEAHLSFYFLCLLMTVGSVV